MKKKKNDLEIIEKAEKTEKTGIDTVDERIEQQLNEIIDEGLKNETIINDLQVYSDNDRNKDKEIGNEIDNYEQVAEKRKRKRRKRIEEEIDNHLTAVPKETTDEFLRTIFSIAGNLLDIPEFVLKDNELNLVSDSFNSIVNELGFFNSQNGKYFVFLTGLAGIVIPRLKFVKQKRKEKKEKEKEDDNNNNR